ncbi:hypothetical protein GCM10010340_49540 [Streptomyces griseoloalbus]|nr:hypothetical protein GCM10010340_49540 [Streptomyces albaduncus]
MNLPLQHDQRPWLDGSGLDHAPDIVVKISGADWYRHIITAGGTTEMARRSGFGEPTLRSHEKVGPLGTVARELTGCSSQVVPGSSAVTRWLGWCVRATGSV